MAGLHIDRSRCRGCGLCVRACASRALSLQDGQAVVDPARCTLCGLCVQSCRFSALSLERGDSAPAEQSAGVWVFCQQSQGVPLPVAAELLGCGRALADARGTELTALLCGADEAQARRLISFGADRVLLCGDARTGDGTELSCAALIGGLIERRRPEIVLFGATDFGRSLAPRVAARLGTGLTADCTRLEIDEAQGLLLQTRPAFGGNLMAQIVCPQRRPQMATVRPGVMQALPPDEGRVGVIERIAPPEPDRMVTLLRQYAAAPSSDIGKAEVIVSVGRGIGRKKNLALARELAALLGGTVGVSRPLVDLGWADHACQIGQTGHSVAPKLLIACGISGAVQHLAGIGGAQTVVAINTDPDAPIFSVADYKLVGDCTEILPLLIAKVKKQRA